MKKRQGFLSETLPLLLYVTYIYICDENCRTLQRVDSDENPLSEVLGELYIKKPVRYYFYYPVRLHNVTSVEDMQYPHIL